MYQIIAMGIVALKSLFKFSLFRYPEADVRLNLHYNINSSHNRYINVHSS